MRIGAFRFFYIHDGTPYNQAERLRIVFSLKIVQMSKRFIRFARCGNRSAFSRFGAGSELKRNGVGNGKRQISNDKTYGNLSPQLRQFVDQVSGNRHGAGPQHTAGQRSGRAHRPERWHSHPQTDRQGEVRIAPAHTRPYDRDPAGTRSLDRSVARRDRVARRSQGRRTPRCTRRRVFPAELHRR